MSEEKKETVEEFDVETAIKESRDFVADILMYDAESEKPMFLVQKPEFSADGSLTIVCVTDQNDKTAVVHTIMSGRVNHDGQLVDSDGTVLEPEAPEEKKSNIIMADQVGAKIVGLDGEEL